MPITNPLVIGSISAEETKGIPWCPLKNPTTPAGYTSLGWYRFRYIRSMHSTSRVTWLARTSATLAGRIIPGSGRHCSYESANRFGRFNAGPATIPHLGSAGAYDLPPALRIASSGWGGAPLGFLINTYLLDYSLWAHEDLNLAPLPCQKNEQEVIYLVECGMTCGNTFVIVR